jgi:hypothetical protein
VKRGEENSKNGFWLEGGSEFKKGRELARDHHAPLSTPAENLTSLSKFFLFS